jgi:hypothetical protein
MMKKMNPTLAKAIGFALSGVALSLAGTSVASAHVAYNTYNAHTSYTPTDAGAEGTDGWVWGFQGTSGGNPANATGWVGSTGAPLGYVGAPHLNWAAMLHSAGGSLEVSQADAFADYGIYADIDTAGGAWRDVSGTPQGWKHNTDIGLFKSDVTQYVHLNISAINGPIANFGVTVFEGMATNLTGYSHHGAWNNRPAGSLAAPTLNRFPIGMANPFGTTGLSTVVGYDETVDSLNAFSFLAQAGTVYSIYLGGNGGLNWNQQHDGYVLNITSSPVPVPGAVWLFGSAMLGMLGMRRKAKLVA